MIETPTLTPDTEQAPEPSLIPAILSNISSPNLAALMKDTDLGQIGAKVVEEFQIDLQSRKDAGWDEKHDQAVKLAMQVREAKTFPWQNAANIKYPLVTTAAIQFAARAYPAIVDGWNVAKGKVLGKPTPEKRDRADRVGNHLSWQLLEEMPEWEADTDRLLHMLPVVGCMIRKTWFDPIEGRNKSRLIPPERFVVHYMATEDKPRETEIVPLYPHQVLERVRSGLWLDIVLDSQADESAPVEFLEQHRLLDLDGDGYPEPYIVTVHKDQQKVVRIVARYDEDGVTLNPDGTVRAIRGVPYYTKYGFIPSLDGSWYDIGFGHLLHSLNETINATINQLLDAGALANTGGGFIGGGVTLKGGSSSFKLGEWKRVQNEGGDLARNIVPLPVREPSAVLFSLLGMMVEAAKDITATKDILTGETQQANQPVGTTLAMIEQGLKVFSAIYKRVHRSLRSELTKLARLNRLFLDDQVYFEFHDKPGVAARADYESGDVDVIPVSDPTVVSDMQRIGRAQFLMQFLGKGMNDKVITERVLGAASIPDIEELFPQGPPPPSPEEMKIKADIAARDRELRLKERQADAEIAAKLAGAEKITLESLLTDPALFEAVARIVRAEMQSDDDGSRVQGVAGQPADGQGDGGAQGPAVGPGGAMGGGGFPGAGNADDGQDIGGNPGPGLV
jgi:chaperonin GroES